MPFFLRAAPLPMSAPAPPAVAAVLLVEDDPACARRLARLLGQVHPGASVAHAGSLAQAGALWPARGFDLALVDLHLPDGSGLALLEAFSRARPPLEAVVVSAWGHTDTIVAAIQAGARGYLLKSAEDDELVRALACMRAGGAPIDPLVAARILALLASAPGHGASTAPPAPGAGSGAADGVLRVALSARELQVLHQVALGDTNREIAHTLGLSVHTVECHTRSIYRKLVVRTRTEAVVLAQAQGWL
ncbi:response regulator transcription factor [Acidovorax sp. SUPP2825]|nr:response regulator transcription factor [Acidovorax sp. SUPP2825]